MLEPQGTLFLLLLVAAFAGLMVWLVLTKQVAFRVLAAILAFIPSMVFGIAVVNKYYDYYQSWGALFSDLSGESAQPLTHLSAAGLGDGTGKSIAARLAQTTNPALDAADGNLFSTSITGPSSHITRQVYIYLPPQYFAVAYANYKFPAIELLHGSPGQPQSWVNVMNVIPIYLQLLAEHKAQPAVLVMPDTDGGLQYALQCLNAPGGLQDMTFVGREVPEWVAANLRVAGAGGAWGIGGYSEGGFCAANIALNYPSKFGFAGSLSGYFAPTDSQVPAQWKPNGRPIDINVFKGHPGLALRNTPDKYILHLPVTVAAPQFWLAAGNEDQSDVQAANYFQQLLLTRLAQVPLDIVKGGGHQAIVWRASLGPMLKWMTNHLLVKDPLVTKVVPKHGNGVITVHAKPDNALAKRPPARLPTVKPPSVPR
ncbi:MAG: alpha/beta hydrolase [Trebonia sp.]